MNLNECSVHFNYSFRSGLGALDEGRFVREHQMEMVLTDVEGREVEQIGKVKFLMVYMDHAWESRIPLIDILDAHSEYLARHIFEAIDPETGEFEENLLKYYEYQVFNPNVCLIENIQVLPKFRGFQLGAKAMKDLIFHYGSVCGLFMIQPYPLQFETPEKVKENRLLELENLEKDEEKATFKLMAYYQKVGFEAIEGIENLLFYNPALRNSKLDKIDLEDCDVFTRKGDGY